MVTLTNLWFGGHKIDLLAPTVVIDGGSVSLTMISKLQLARLVPPSDTAASTSLVPTGKVEPEAGSTVTTTKLVSIPETTGAGKSTTAEQRPGSLETTISGGQVMVT